MENPYVYVIVALASVAFASFAVYDADKLREARMALGVILLASLVLPLCSALKGISALDFNYEIEYGSSELVDTALEEAFCQGIAEAVREEFSIKKEEILVTARGFDSENMRAEELFVTLSGRAVVKDIRAVSDFVSGLGVGKCTVEVQFG